jgi:SAM-dependent methyltransferase
MRGYGKSFARAYNLMWTDFADQAAPAIIAFYRETEHGRNHGPVLDLCCGVGAASLHFLAAGFPTVGMDLSEPMLEIARRNAREYIDSGKAEFIHADASSFTLTSRFGLVVSLFDSLNHLPDLASLAAAFACVRAVLLPGGQFVFDLNTRAALKRWDQIEVLEEDHVTIIKRGGFDPAMDRAFHRVSGFIQNDDGLFERFDETIVERAFTIAETREALKQAGFRTITFTDHYNLEEVIEPSDNNHRLFIRATV